MMYDSKIQYLQWSAVLKCRLPFPKATNFQLAPHSIYIYIVQATHLTIRATMMVHLRLNINEKVKQKREK